MFYVHLIVVSTLLSSASHSKNSFFQFLLCSPIIKSTMPFAAGLSTSSTIVFHPNCLPNINVKNPQIISINSSTIVGIMKPGLSCKMFTYKLVFSVWNTATNYPLISKCAIHFNGVSVFHINWLWHGFELTFWIP